MSENVNRRGRRIRTTCQNCQHSTFDEVMGEYKCKIKKRVIYDPDRQMRCHDFKKRSVTEVES